MKKLVFYSAMAALLLAPAHARTWKSADGSKTFEGTLRSYDKNSGTVKVVTDGGTMITFHQSVLSGDDREFLLSEESRTSLSSEPADFTAELEKTKVGKLVAAAKLQLVDKKHFKSAKLAKAPEYYILYFSASW